MESKLYVALIGNFDEETLSRLIRLGAKALQKNELMVPLDKLAEAERVIKQKITLPQSDLNFLRKILEERESQVVIGDTARKSQTGHGAQIKASQNYYILVIPHTGQEYRIPQEIVDAYIKVISFLKKKGVKKIKKRELVSMVFRETGLFGMYEKNGEFHWEAFYGDRTMYHTHYYGPIKIIESWRLIKVPPSDEIEIL